MSSEDPRRPDPSQPEGQPGSGGDEGRYGNPDAGPDAGGGAGGGAGSGAGTPPGYGAAYGGSSGGSYGGSYGASAYPPPGQPAGYPPPPPEGYGQGFGYGAPGGGPGPVAPQNDGLALGAMIVGIVSLALSCGYGLSLLAAPVALVMGRTSMKRIDRSGGRLGGRGMALAGFVLGIIGTVLLVLALLAIIATLVIAAQGGFSSAAPALP